MRKELAKYFFIIFHVLFAQYLLAGSHCLYPVEEEKKVFYFINLSTSQEYTDKYISDLLDIKVKNNEHSITCYIKKGIFQVCETPWGGKVNTFINKGNSKWGKIISFVDKNNKLIVFDNLRRLEFTDRYLQFEWFGPIPKLFYLDPIGYMQRRGSSFKLEVPIGLGIVNQCNNISSNKYLIENSTSTYKQPFYINNKVGYYALRRMDFIKFGPKIQTSETKGGF